MKKTFSFAVALVMIFTFFATPAFAAEPIDPGFGWSGEIPTNRPNVRYIPKWEQTDFGIYETDIGEHHHWSYIMVNLNDTTHVKGFTHHYDIYGNRILYGYSRAMITSIFGEIYDGTDSGRVWGYGESEAITPLPALGGIARTYCGDTTMF